MFKYARNKKGEIIKDFAGNPFLFEMREDADGFLRDILGLHYDEYTIHYMIPRHGVKLSAITEEEIENARMLA